MFIFVCCSQRWGNNLRCLKYANTSFFLSYFTSLAQNLSAFSIVLSIRFFWLTYVFSEKIVGWICFPTLNNVFLCFVPILLIELTFCVYCTCLCTSLSQIEILYIKHVLYTWKYQEMWRFLLQYKWIIIQATKIPTSIMLLE